MVKAWEEYYNDPGIIHEHPILREIHAIRLMKADERKDYTPEEYDALVNKRADEFLAACRAQRAQQA